MKSTINNLQLTINFFLLTVKSEACQLLTVKREPLRGFTLVELLVVFGVMSIISAATVASFSTYNNTQVLQSASSDVKNMLHVARLRALSQVKPPQCITEQLSGYAVNIDTTSNQYVLNVLCDRTYALETKKLPKNVSFRTDSTQTIVFPVLTGNPTTSAAIVLVGYGTSHGVSVDTGGSIVIAKGTVPTIISGPTPTPSTCLWWEWWSCANNQLNVTPTPVVSTPTPTRVPTPTSVVPTPVPTTGLSSYTVYSPATGERWAPGTQHVIRWVPGSSGNTVSMRLIDVPMWVTYGTIVSNIPDTGSYTWTVPASIPSSTYKIYIYCNVCSPLQYAYGNEFYIGD